MSTLSLRMQRKIEDACLEEGVLVIRVASVSKPRNKPGNVKLEIGIDNVDTGEPIVEIGEVSLYQGEKVELRDIQKAFHIGFELKR